MFNYLWINWIKPIFEVQELKNKNAELSAKILEQNKMIKELNGYEGKEDFWNSKWPKNRLLYTAQGKYKRDVRTILVDNSYILEDIITKNKLKGYNDDSTAYNILRWVVKNIKYKHDDVNFGEVEYWANPEILVQHGYGDCDDFATLIKSLCLVAGIPDYKVKVCAGWVRTKTGKGGHAYCIYLRESDDEWIILDGTYYVDLKPIPDRVKHKDDKRYLDIWWTFTKEYTFTQKSTTI